MAIEIVDFPIKNCDFPYFPVDFGHVSPPSDPVDPVSRASRWVRLQGGSMRR